MSTEFNYHRATSWLVLTTTMVKCVLASIVGLGNDEVYYYTYAVQPDWNYFDHPPLIGLAIRICTFNLAWVNDFSMRLPAILGSALCTWLIFRCASMIKNDGAGWIAALLYQTSLYTGIIAGLFILPDSVQLVFWLAAVLTMLKIAQNSPNGTALSAYLLLGFWIGLAALSKVHAAFLWVGFAGWALFHDRKQFAKPGLYLGGMVTLTLFSPVVYWNIANDFATWRFHSERVTVQEGGFDFKAAGAHLAGMVAYQNPLNVCLIMAALWPSVGNGVVPHKIDRLLRWCSFPIILAAITVSLFRSTLPHWSGPGAITLMILTACLLTDRAGVLRSATHKKMLTASVLLTGIIFIAGPTLINLYPGTLGDESTDRLGSGDFTLDMYGWKSFEPEFERIRQTEIKQGTMTADAPIIIHKWFPGGHLYYYVARPAKMRVIGVGSVGDLHQFAWMNAHVRPLRAGDSAWFISPSSNATDPKAIYAQHFERVSSAGKVTQFRGGKPVRVFRVYRLVHWKRSARTVKDIFFSRSHSDNTGAASLQHEENFRSCIPPHQHTCGRAGHLPVPVL